MTTFERVLLLLCVPLLVWACGEGGEATREGAASGEPAARSEEAGQAGAAVPGTPAGGLERWVEDIRTGLDGVPAGAASPDAAVRDSAGQRVLQLYLSRQEFIERYYGQGGLRSGGAPLTAAVDSAEARFHRLMEATSGEAPADSAAVAAAVDSLRARLGEILRAARDAGVPLDPPTGGAQEDTTAVGGRGAAVAEPA